jgi:MFS family permease
MFTRNLFLLSAIKLAKWFMLYMPVSFLFYLENGFSEKEYLLLHALYSGIIALLEVPSGYLADVWGRKPALIAGTFFGVLGFGTYSFSYGFYGFLAAEIFLGAGQSLLSGADTALLYDTLHQEGKEKSYIKVEGRISALGNISEAAAGLFVSVIIFDLYRQYFQLQTFIAALAFFAALFLREPSIHRAGRRAGPGDILSIIHSSLKKNRTLRNLIFFSAAVGCASLSMAWLAQPVFAAIGLDENKFGIAWVLLNGMVMLGSLSARRVDSILTLRWSLVYMVFSFTAGFVILGMNLSFIAFVPLLFLFFVRGTSHPVLKNYINLHAESSERATVLSLRSLLIRTMFFLLGPVLGFVSDRLSLEYALYLCALVLFIPLFLFLVLLLAGYRGINK